MLTFVSVTDMPGMPDAHYVVRAAISEIGKPDYVFVINAENHKVFALLCPQDAVQISADILQESFLRAEKGGDFVFLLSVNFNLIGDILLRRLFKEIRPAPGCRARLLQVNPRGDGNASVVVCGDKQNCR